MPRNNLTREGVLLAAIALVNQEGLRQLSLKRLAESLQVKTPALYNHIGGMAELQAEMALCGLQQLAQALGNAAIGRAGDEAVYAVGRAYIAFAKEQPGLYEATQWTNLWHEDVRVHGASDSIIAILDRIFAAYQFSEIQLCHAIRLFRSFCHGFAALELNHGFGNTVAGPQSSFDEGLRIILEGIHSSYGAQPQSRKG